MQSDTLFTLIGMGVAERIIPEIPEKQSLLQFAIVGYAWSILEMRNLSDVVYCISTPWYIPAGSFVASDNDLQAFLSLHDIRPNMANESIHLPVKNDEESCSMILKFSYLTIHI